MILKFNNRPIIGFAVEEDEGMDKGGKHSAKVESYLCHLLRTQHSLPLLPDSRSIPVVRLQFGSRMLKVSASKVQVFKSVYERLKHSMYLSVVAFIVEETVFTWWFKRVIVGW